ncbi:PREDICTED: WD repeat-containing protein 89 [Nicrophorus vespilloides]|uniref:WD repeat-containing protein 89 n=1 Tax=Nicrophorus vespilloides TaxID=110193 RepID=A0ABM1NE35_NICVS|nr:PREDICTED: WD repeat-containing protein 89 [Nicrophorus vespilloides]
MMKKMINLELEGNENEVEDETDCDVCSADEIQSIFAEPYENIVGKKIVENDYILHLDATLETSYNIAIGTSGSDVHVCNLSENGLQRIETFSDNAPCVGVKFDTTNSNILFSGHNDSTIKMWDLRTPSKTVQIFNDKTNKKHPKKKVFSCFDLSTNSILLAAGTELHDSDAYILFWDARNSNILGGYWEYHTDVITQAKFHPNDPNKLATGSTDGLINIYDLSQTTEDEAIENTLNTNSSVEQIRWYPHKKTSEKLAVTTHTYDAQLWDVEMTEIYAEFDRENLAENLKRKIPDYIYTAANYVNKSGELVLLIGSNNQGGRCLRGLKVDNNKLKPCYNFQENSQRIRSCCYNSTVNNLLTAGEEGVLNVWKFL